MKFLVKENGKNCNGEDFNLSNVRWATNEFPTFEEAIEYTKQWLGTIYTLPDNWDGNKYDYSGYGDNISIEKIMTKEEVVEAILKLPEDEEFDKEAVRIMITYLRTLDPVDAAIEITKVFLVISSGQSTIDEGIRLHNLMLEIRKEEHGQ